MAYRILIADPLAGLLPGLTAKFTGMEVLDPGALQRALEAHRETLIQREQALSFVVSLPALNAQEPRPEALGPAAAQPSRPTPARLMYRIDHSLPPETTTPVLLVY